MARVAWAASNMFVTPLSDCPVFTVAYQKGADFQEMQLDEEHR